MQIYALDAHSSLIHARAAQKRHTYMCPECAGSVRLRGGSFRQLHFYHLEPSSCRLQGKSATHLHIQHILQKMLAPEQVLLEYRFPEIGRIADVVWPAKKLIFEIQVSPISAKEVQLRNKDYNQIGYTVVWILHDRRFNRPHITKAEAHLRFSPHYFTNINAFGKGFFYDQYASIRFKRRVQRTIRFPVRFKQVMPVNLKQLPRQFPPERKQWPFCFEGDMHHRRYNWEIPAQSSFSLTRLLLNSYKIFLHFLLEKTTY